LTDKTKLEIAIIKSGLTKHEVAKRLGLSDMGFYKKLNNVTEFKASEIAKLKEILKLKAIEPIFLLLK
jgi:hypothetical protein